jgi:hypothetical protein
VTRARVFALGAVGVALSALVLGCGGGAPLLHGAHALGPGTTASGLGFSGTFTAGGARAAVDAARSNGSTMASRDVLLKDGAVRTAMAPTVAPWVGARIGIPGDNEAGLSFTGRALRIDARHAFESGPWAFSLGAGGTTTWRGADSTGDNGSALMRIRSGFGFDVPALVGWRSDAGVVSLWGGARGGLESIDVWTNNEQGSMALTSDLDLLRRYVGGVAGLAMGLRHVHVALELDVFYQWVSGNVDGTVVKVEGITLSPAGAVIFTF